MPLLVCHPWTGPAHMQQVYVRSRSMHNFGELTQDSQACILTHMLKLKGMFVARPDAHIYRLACRATSGVHLIQQPGPAHLQHMFARSYGRYETSNIRYLSIPGPGQVGVGTEQKEDQNQCYVITSAHQQHRDNSAIHCFCSHKSWWSKKGQNMIQLQVLAARNKMASK